MRTGQASFNIDEMNPLSSNVSMDLTDCLYGEDFERNKYYADGRQSLVFQKEILQQLRGWSEENVGGILESLTEDGGVQKMVSS